MKSRASIATIVSVVMLVASVSQTFAIPFDAFTPLVNTNASGLVQVKRNVPGTADAHSSVSLVLDGDDYASTAFAETNGLFGVPIAIGPTFIPNLGRAHVEAQVENFDRAVIRTTARASATFVYFIEVLGPPSPPNPVEVDIAWSLAGSGDGVGSGSAQILVSILTRLDPSSGGLIRVNESVIDGASSGISPVFVDLTDSLPDQLRVELRAQCGTSGLEAFFAACQATVDPTFSIPSSFPDADQYRLEFSPNLAPGAVPQPSTALLAVTALLAFAVRRRAQAHPR